MGWGREVGVPGSPTPTQRRDPALPRACKVGQGGVGGAVLSVPGPTA